MNSGGQREDNSGGGTGAAKIISNSNSCNMPNANLPIPITNY
jgi:hypothetical protein